MISRINTFLLAHDRKIENLIEYDPSKFISIKDEPGIKNYFSNSKFSEMYISGYIDFVYTDQVIFSWQQWDLIDQLWVYILNGIREAVVSKEASFTFPDQPLSVKISDLGNGSILFVIDNKKHVLPYDVLLNCLLPEAAFFFETIMKYTSSETYIDVKENLIPQCRALLK
jgi:hypothetical protein